MRIRAVSTDDAERIAELLEVLGYPSSQEDVEGRLAAIRARTDFAAWVAEEEGRVDGFGGAAVAPYFERNGLYGRVLVLVVDPASQGKGLGRRLILEAENWLEAQGASRIIINSGSHRVEAHQFYRSLGYGPTGVRFVKDLPTAG